MGCTKCGSDAKLIDLMFTKLLQEALKDGTLQAGLKSCSNERLEKNTNVVLCDELETAVCTLIQEGRLCINEPATIHWNPETGKLAIGMTNGEVLDTTLGLNDTNTKNKTMSLNGNILELVDTDNKKVSVDLSKYQNDGNTKNASLTLNANNELVLRDSDGAEIKVALGGLKTKLTAGAGLQYNETNGQLSVTPDNTTIKVNAQGKLEVIPQGCKRITDLNDLPFTENGVFCIYGTETAANLPANISSPALSQARGSQTSTVYDWVGYVVRTNGEALVYVTNSGIVWTSNNDTNVSAGSKTPTTGWSIWRRETNAVLPQPTVRVTNAFGDRTLFYGRTTGE